MASNRTSVQPLLEGPPLARRANAFGQASGQSQPQPLLASPRVAARPPAPVAPMITGRTLPAGAKLAPLAAFAASLPDAGVLEHSRLLRTPLTASSAGPLAAAAPVVTTQTQLPSANSSRTMSATPGVPLRTTRTEHLPASIEAAGAPAASVIKGSASAERTAPVAAAPTVTKPAAARAPMK